ncbi:Protein of unknown function [Gryllus bimaculatus]|nr:Protein of unknown function [Gryllus bimaculatus]
MVQMLNKFFTGLNFISMFAIPHISFESKLLINVMTYLIFHKLLLKVPVVCALLYQYSHYLSSCNVYERCLVLVK